MRLRVIVALCGLSLAGLIVGATRSVAAQAELDRIVARVNNKIITRSDIRQAKMLKLVDDTSSDEATRRCLEDRLLILAEISRLSSPVPSSDADIAARRSTWERAVGGSGSVAGLLADGSMSAGTLDAWLRDDVRVQAHLKRQFGNVPDADRARATADWVARLRQRAGLR